MALRPLHKCNSAGCNTLTRQPRCEQHSKEKRIRGPESRGNSSQRGYDARWQKLRLVKLGEQPLCEDCLSDGRVEAANEVHHIAKVSDEPAMRLDWDNLMSLCKACHSRRTARGE